MQEDQITTIKFRDDTIFAVNRADGVFIAVKPIAETMGLAWQSQLQRLKDDPVLSEGITTIVIPSLGGSQETTCLRLDLLNGWLFKIDPRRVKEEIRERLIVYQKECYAVLFRHFQPTAAAEAETVVPAFEEPLNNREWLSMTREVRLLWGISAARRLWAMSPLPQVQHMTSRFVARDTAGGVECLAVLLDKAPAPLLPETAQDAEAQVLLAAAGLRVYGNGVFVRNGDVPVFTGTRWARGAHRDALLSLPGVIIEPVPRSLAGAATRGIIVPWSLIVAEV